MDVNIFDSFFFNLNDLNKSFDFGLAIKGMFDCLPPEYITALGLIFCLSALGFVIRFIKGWF